MNYSEIYNKLKQHFNTHLKDSGVKLPRFSSKLGLSLTILYANMDKFVHIDEIKKKLIENGHLQLEPTLFKLDILAHRKVGG